jgi:hypothetical protein
MSANRNRIEALAAGPFFVVRVNVVNAVGGLHEAILLDYLLRWGELAEDGWAYRTEEQITADTTLNRYWQRNARKALIDLGLLHEDRRGLPSRNYYRVDYDRLHDLLGDDRPASPTNVDSQERPPSPFLGGDGSLTYKGDTEEEQEKKNTYTREFEDWWARWPKKGDTKYAAFRSWRNLTRAQQTVAADVLPKWLPFYASIQNKHIPNASTWLNQRRWEGEPPPIEQPRVALPTTRPVYRETQAY